MNNYDIKPVEEHNWREVTKLKVSSAQTNYIESNDQSLLEAAYDKRHDWMPHALYYDEIMIGFAMIGAYNVEEKYIWLDRFMIDEHFQGKGHSKPLLHKLLLMIKKKWNPDTIVLSIDSTNENAYYLYEKIGFHINGIIDPNNGEKLMEYKI